MIASNHLPVIIERKENVIALGPSGTGKTHIALGLGLSASFSANASIHLPGSGQKGLPVAFVTASALVNELTEARDEKHLLRRQRQLAKVKLLIIPLEVCKQTPAGQWTGWASCRSAKPEQSSRSS